MIFYECNDYTTALQRRVFANCVMALYLLKVLLQKFLSVPITQKCQILSCDTCVAYERYVPHIASFRRRGASVGIVTTLQAERP